MANQLKYKIAIIVVAIGIGLLPIGYLVNGYTLDQANVGVSDVLIEYRENIVPYIEENYMGVGIPEAIAEFAIEESDVIESSYVRYFFIPDILVILKDDLIDKFSEFINSTYAARAISLNISDYSTLNGFSESVAEDRFFNNLSYSFRFDGVSNYTDLRLDYSSTAIENFLRTGINQAEITIPGFYSDFEFGAGISAFLDAYEDTFDPIDGDSINATLQIAYNCNWTQLTSLYNYLKAYLMPLATSSISNMEDFAEKMFYKQWANRTWTEWVASPTRLDLRLVYPDLENELRRYELNTLSDITYEISKQMWDPANSSSFLNQSGFQKWYDAFNGNGSIRDELKLTFQITQDQYEDVRNWLFGSVRSFILPALFPLTTYFDMTTDEFAEILLYEQWANSTLLSQPIEIDGITGFELGVQSNISLSSVQALFSSTNISSIANHRGIIEWSKAAAEGDSTVLNILANKFKLDATQAQILSVWLNGTFRDIVPDILDELTANNMEYYATNEFFRQWSNLSIYTTGFPINTVLPSINLPQWEVGIDNDLGISQYNARRLWRDNFELAITNPKGIGKWFTSIESPSYYSLLSSEFNLTSAQMDQMHDWLLNFRDNTAIPFIEIQTGTNLVEQANSLFGVLSITSYAIIIVGIAIGVIFWMFEKRR